MALVKTQFIMGICLFLLRVIQNGYLFSTSYSHIPVKIPCKLLSYIDIFPWFTVIVLQLHDANVGLTLYHEVKPTLVTCIVALTLHISSTQRREII